LSLGQPSNIRMLWMCVNIDSSIPISNMPFKFILILTIYMSNNIMDNLDLIIQGLLLNFLNQNFKFLTKHLLLLFLSKTHNLSGIYNQIWMGRLIKYGNMRLDLASILNSNFVTLLNYQSLDQCLKPINYFNNRWIALAMKPLRVLGPISQVKMIIWNPSVVNIFIVSLLTDFNISRLACLH